MVDRRPWIEVASEHMCVVLYGCNPAYTMPWTTGMLAPVSAERCAEAEEAWEEMVSRNSVGKSAKAAAMAPW